MGKKKRTVDYDKEALTALAKNINYYRKSLSDGKIPVAQISLEKLEQTIKILPQNHKESLERFWGLIPGTRKHYHGFAKRNRKDIALQNMFDNSMIALYDLMKIEHLQLYAENVRSIVVNIFSKLDKAGVEGISDIDAIKYLLVFLIFIEGGPVMLFEGEGYEIDLEEEGKSNYDEFALLYTFWDGFGAKCEESSIKLALMIDIIEMFDLKDVITMKSFLRLPISKSDRDIEPEELISFREIRFFKERVFSSGPWEFSDRLVFQIGMTQESMERVANHFINLRGNWNNISEFEDGTKKIRTSKGEIEMVSYKIEEFEFTDVYEIMVLCASRNW